MGAKYCKNTRCSGVKDGKPCPAADDCDLFIWDIERQKGEKKEEPKKENKSNGGL